MQSALYVSLSGQVTLEKRLETIANNLANMKTAAFRADAVKFETAMSRAASSPSRSRPPATIYLAQARQRDEYRQHPRRRRRRPRLDGVHRLRGTVYTRDGRMQSAPTANRRRSPDTRCSTPAARQSWSIPRGGPPTIARSGAITQGTNQVGQLGLFEYSRRREAGTLWQFGGDSRSRRDGRARFYHQRFPAGLCRVSNVDPLSELTQLMTAERAFQSVSSLIESSEGTMQNAIRSLGEPTKSQRPVTRTREDERAGAPRNHARVASQGRADRTGWRYRLGSYADALSGGGPVAICEARRTDRTRNRQSGPARRGRAHRQRRRHCETVRFPYRGRPRPCRLSPAAEDDRAASGLERPRHQRAGRAARWRRPAAGRRTGDVDGCRPAARDAAAPASAPRCGPASG